VSREVVDPKIVAFLRELGTGLGESTSVVPMSGDASTRRYFRMGEPPRTSVLALYPEPFVALTMPFLMVRSVLAGCSIPVPAVLAHDGPRGILLLQDLGDHTLQDALEQASDRERGLFYREALDQLATLQREAARGPQRAPCFQMAFDVAKLSWELDYFLTHFVLGHRAATLSVEDREALSGGFRRLSEEIAAWPRVLCHRVYHSRNLMPHEGTLHWIDFQDARMGPNTYDLASLLRDSYVELPEEFVAEHVESFRRRVAPGEEPGTFLRRFEIMSVQRNLKALGTFGYMTTVRGSHHYLRYIPRTLANARRNLLRHPELAGLHRVLARHIEELA
jgi:hypothetical protein